MTNERYSYQFWAHATFGDVYAVAVDTQAGVVVGANGPLNRTREIVPSQLPNYDYDSDLAHEIEYHRGQYRLFDPDR